MLPGFPRAGSGTVSFTLRRLQRRRLGLLVGLAALALGVVLSLTLGSRSIALAEVRDAIRAFDPASDTHLIIRQLRIPRTCVAMLAGAALGIAGALMQAVTRNSLAEPGLLGINGGAALAVIIGAAAFAPLGMPAATGLAFCGAALAASAVFILGRANQAGTDPVRLVLAGAGLTVILASLTGIVIVNAPAEVFDQFRHWAAGSLERSNVDAVRVLSLAVLAGGALAMSIVGNLNVLALGKDLGLALGASAQVTWLLACLAVTLLAGAATAGAGPIGFIGLVAPHLARSVVGPDYRWVIPYSALFAAVLLLGADVLGRLVASPEEIAAGTIAALLGGPFFIAVVRKYRISRL